MESFIAKWTGNSEMYLRDLNYSLQYPQRSFYCTEFYKCDNAASLGWTWRFSSIRFILGNVLFWYLYRGYVQWLHINTYYKECVSYGRGKRDILKFKIMLQSKSYRKNKQSLRGKMENIEHDLKQNKKGKLMELNIKKTTDICWVESPVKEF